MLASTSKYINSTVAYLARVLCDRDSVRRETYNLLSDQKNKCLLSLQYLSFTVTPVQLSYNLCQWYYCCHTLHFFTYWLFVIAQARMHFPNSSQFFYISALLPPKADNCILYHKYYFGTKQITIIIIIIIILSTCWQQ